MAKDSETDVAPKGGFNVGAVAAFGVALAIVVGYAFGLHGSDFAVEDWRSAVLMALVVAIPFILLSILGILLWLSAAALIILLMGMLISDDAFFVETIDRLQGFGNGVCGFARVVIQEQDWLDPAAPEKYRAWMCPDGSVAEAAAQAEPDSPAGSAPAPATEDAAPATGGAGGAASE